MDSVKEPSASQPEANIKESAARRDDSPDGLTKLDSFLQIFCIFQGTCFFLFPAYLRNVGMIPGIFLGYAVTLSYLYLTNLYFWSEHQLKEYDSSVETVTLYTLVELIFTRIGNLPRLGLYLNLYLKYEIILSWLLGMSFSLLFICQNFVLILHNFGYDEDEKTILLYLIIPLALVCFTPNLATLNKAFYLSSLVIIVIMIETFYYILTDQSPLPGIKFFGSLEAIPTYLNNIIFTISLTPLLFLYRGEMRNANDFTSIFGSLNTAICANMIVCITYSMACNIRYGGLVHENIIRNLPNNLLINTSNLVMTVIMILSGGVLFYGIFISLWVGTLDMVFTDVTNINYYKYAVKGVMFTFIIIVTSVAPSLSTFLNLLSSFSLPYDTIILPIALETIIVWKLSANKLKKYLFLLKNVIIIFAAVLFALWSLTDALVQMFSPTHLDRPIAKNVL